jgi:hypothetical protein
MKTNDSDAGFASMVSRPIPYWGTRRKNAHPPGSAEAELPRAAKTPNSSEPREVN